MNIVPKLVAEELTSLRHKKHESIKYVADVIGIHPNTLSNYEKGLKDIPLSVLESLLKHYEIDELIFFKIIREYSHYE